MCYYHQALAASDVAAVEEATLAAAIQESRKGFRIASGHMDSMLDSALAESVSTGGVGVDDVTRTSEDVFESVRQASEQEALAAQVHNSTVVIWANRALFSRCESC